MRVKPDQIEMHGWTDGTADEEEKTKRTETSDNVSTHLPGIFSTHILFVSAGYKFVHSVRKKELQDSREYDEICLIF